jgi:hypothetical protein
MPATVFADVALNLGIAADVTLLVAKAAVDLGGGVPLLGRGGFVIEEDLIDQRLEWPQLGGGSISGQRLGMGVSGSGWGSACTRACRTVRRE